MYYLQLAFDLTFTTVEFLLFFIVVMIGIIATQRNLKLQNILLLLASYLFYASWDPRFLSLILISTVIDYYCGQKIHQTDEEKKRKSLLTLSLCSNLSILFFFKYFNFFIDSFAHLSQLIGLPFSYSSLNIILPVGISFYTFQSLSYTIDIYRRKLEPEYNFLNFALYVGFFPQLVAGPIEKARDLLPQVSKQRNITREDLSYGFYLAFWGLFKKVVVADNLATIVNTIYGYETLSGFDVFVGTLAFAFQIYADFSGYTDIARGVARMLGFKLSLNFNLPYFAKNMSDFWRRWHISLSSWIHEYIYIAVGGNRNGTFKTYRNLFISMTLSGLWHGAAWNFVIWGIYHSILMSLVKFTGSISWLKNIFKLIPNFFKILFTFMLTLYGWLLFRVESFEQIVGYTKALLFNFEVDALGLENLALVLFYSSMIYVVQLFQYFSGDLDIFYRNYYVRIAFMAILFITILIFGGSYAQEFIYFQF